MSGFKSTGGGKRNIEPNGGEGEDAVNPPKIIKLGLHPNVVTELPAGHAARQVDQVWFPMSPSRKTVGDLVERAKEKLRIPCQLMITMDGGLLMPEISTGCLKNLPSSAQLKLRRHFPQANPPPSAQDSGILEESYETESDNGEGEQ